MKVVAASVFIIGFLVGKAAAFDCSEGCDLDTAVNGDPVCGDDGLIYPNRCFAICQGVIIAASNDSCLASGGKLTNNAATETTGFIPISAITAYQDEGFKYVRKIDYSKVTGIVREPSYNVFGNVAADLPTVGAMKLTTEGHEYRSQSNIMEDSLRATDAGPRSVAPYNPTHADRFLGVIGTDNRVRITGTSVFPYRIIGQIGYYPDNLICSGTVIYKSTVVTAAHCVYDYDNQDWTAVSYFAPGRYAGTLYNDPYGRWYAQTVTMKVAYQQTGSRSYDYSVITLEKDNTNNYNYYIGEYLGYAGLAESSGFNDPLLDGSTITGYPGELTNGRGMWRSGPCASGVISMYDWLVANNYNTTGWASDRMALYNCDTSGGMSGSSILDSEGYVRGVHTFDLSSKGYNGGGVMIQGSGYFDDIMRWSGRPLPTTPAPAPKPTPGTPPAPTPGTPPAPTPTPCFSSHNTVYLKDIGNIPITQLKIGDHVRGGNGYYTQVYGFGHRNDHVATEFLQLSFAFGAKTDSKEVDLPLEITPKHLLFVERNEAMVVLPASDVVIGDVVMCSHGKKGARVSEVRQVQRYGVYTPLTFTGDIEVSGVVASNHVYVLNHPVIVWNQHMLGQAMWFPRRLFCRLFMEVCKKESYDRDGYSIWSSWFIYFGSVANMLSWMGAWIVNMFGIPCMITIHVLEPYPMFSFSVFLLVTTTAIYWLPTRSK